MDLGLGNKVAIIAGGSRGIGRAAALALAEEGCRLVLAARGEDELRGAASAVEAKGAEVLAVACDLTQAADAEHLVASTIERFGQIDILVNSIHFSAAGDDDEVWRQSFDILFLPAARLTRLVIPHMRSAGGGSIVHLSSIFGREAGGRPGYNAMKAALLSHAKAMAIESAPTAFASTRWLPAPSLIRAARGGSANKKTRGHGAIRRGEHPNGPIRHRRRGRQRDRLHLLRARLVGDGGVLGSGRWVGRGARICDGTSAVWSFRHYWWGLFGRVFGKTLNFAVFPLGWARLCWSFSVWSFWSARRPDALGLCVRGARPCAPRRGLSLIACIDAPPDIA